MTFDVARWLETLPLSAHRRVLCRLLDEAEADPRIRFVELCCSVARGAGDELSDLDVGIGLADDGWPAALDAIAPLVRRLGDVVDLFEHRIAEWGDRPHQRLFAQLRDGVRIDLVAIPASAREGLPPDSIALYDPDGRLARPLEPSVLRATPGDLREWAFLAWAALADLDKYLRRGSAWEALERLHAARSLVWRLWAAACQLPYPAFGLTSVLDASPAPLPAEIEETVASLDAADLRRAGIATARILERVCADLLVGAEQTAARPDGMARYVAERLRGAPDG